MGSLKDKVIRWVAKSFLLKWADGKKTEIMRIVQGVNMLMLALLWICQYGADFIAALPGGVGELLPAVAFCPTVDFLNAKWVELGAVLAHAGLEFGIQDANAKERLKELPAKK